MTGIHIDLFITFRDYIGESQRFIYFTYISEYFLRCKTNLTATIPVSNREEERANEKMSIVIALPHILKSAICFITSPHACQHFVIRSLVSQFQDTLFECGIYLISELLDSTK